MTGSRSSKKVSCLVTAVDLMTYKPGHTVQVRYDPGDPSTVAIVALYE